MTRRPPRRGRITSGSACGTGWPNSAISPLVAAASPSSIRIVVVLPEPLGPRNPCTSPCRTVRSRSSTATRVPRRPENSLRSPRVSTIGSLIGRTLCAVRATGPRHADPGPVRVGRRSPAWRRTAPRRAARPAAPGGPAAPRGTGTSRPTSCESVVTPASAMPQGTNRSYQPRSTSQLSEMPCIVTPCATRSPMAPTLRSGRCVVGPEPDTAAARDPGGLDAEVARRSRSSPPRGGARSRRRGRARGAGRSGRPPAGLDRGR